MKQPKNRSDLKFVEERKTVEFDYSRDVTDEDIQAMDRAMMSRSGLSGAELHQKLNDGILVNGEEW